MLEGRKSNRRDFVGLLKKNFKCQCEFVLSITKVWFGRSCVLAKRSCRTIILIEFSRPLFCCSVRLHSLDLFVLFVYSSYGDAAASIQVNLEIFIHFEKWQYFLGEQQVTRPPYEARKIVSRRINFPVKDSLIQLLFEFRK